MRVNCIGGGPAGLYVALLLRRLDPGHEIHVFERNGADDTFGWGVVFSDETLDSFERADPDSYRAMERSFASWNDIHVTLRGHRVRSTGHGFCALSRRRLLAILQERCRELGVALHFEAALDAGDIERLRADADLLVGSDGVNSAVRQRYAGSFGPEIDRGRCLFTWLGTDRRYEAFTFAFRENEHGLFQAHAYPFDERRSTFIVECRHEVLARAGLAEDDEAATVAYLEALFREDLEGHRLLSNRSLWRRFATLTNARWHHDNVVLLGDAAHTAHFSVGSGTKLAMEDAIALAACFEKLGAADVSTALAAYEEARRSDVLRLQKAAQTSQAWFENSARYLELDPLQLSFSLLTRSKRITWDNLRQRDPELVERLAGWFHEANPHRDQRVPTPPFAAGVAACEGPRPAVPTPLFQPFRLRELTLANRMVVSPMCQYTCEDGTPGDWQLVHLGSRALGGAGLVMTEATHVSPEGRISPGCAGMYADAHVAAWGRVVEFVHRHTKARIGMQLAHAGRKGASDLPWRGGLPLADGGWELIAPSPLPYDEGWPVPRAATRADMDCVRDQFVRAARMADAAGFDMLELHLAHGYLLGTFLSPLTNLRDDDYGGSIANRMRYPLEVFDAVRAAWPAQKPISVRLSATDWRPGGFSREDRLALARALKTHGCDIADVSAGQTVPDQRPVYGRMFQAPFSEEIRLEVGIPTMSVGNIQNADQCQTLLAAGRADLCVLARPHLRDPYLTLDAAAAYGHTAQFWPPQYLAGRPPAARK